ncbi:hypothetical protein [Methanonatronarchaeum sp. AMET-Sl]|uniref:hypothetical protein n=1 Tax=Methanonatronarchaeum sp. AMET-Sl TaxID=3037654 RepID=UPI00244DBF3A|nr:hypothetical protein [Methanonatronarchaeum sp. AMET-Sl]WGI17772.1 hypothetical protein QEN48_01840 [Methanonatronarchaeum sp. AMET-Sl]
MTKTINQITKNIPDKKVNQETFKAIWKGNKKTLNQLEPNKKYKITNQNQYIILQTDSENKIQILIAKYEPF